MGAAASVVIPTYNRVSELRRTVISLLRQTVQLEILVMDDGSTNETASMIRDEFPQVHYNQLGNRKGPAFQRNRGVERATTNIVIGVDDDAELVSPHTVEQTLAEFSHPKVGAVAMPYINVREDATIWQQCPAAGEIYATSSFVGAAHALRRNVFLSLGGYREHLFYYGEESDFCIRMLNAGYIVRLGSADAIHHLESLRREFPLQDYYGSRNTLLFAYQNAPIHILPVHWLASSWKVARWTPDPPRLANRIKGIAHAHKWCFRNRAERDPVSAVTYRLFRRLRKKGALRFSNIESLLNQPATELESGAGTGQDTRVRVTALDS